MSSKTKLICDLDGVIVDLVRPAMAKYNAEIATEADYPAECEWDIVKAVNTICGHKRLPEITVSHFWNGLDYLFWVQLPKYPNADQFLYRLERMGEVTIATSPTLSSECVAGKFDWIKTRIAQYSRRHQIGADKTVMAGSNSILIDDRDKNCDDFRAAGGRAILVPRPWNHRGWDSCPYNVVLKELRDML